MNLNTIVNIMKIKISIVWLNCFNDIKNYSDAKKMKRLKAEQIYYKIKDSVRCIFKFYELKNITYKYKYFEKWKRNSLHTLQIDKLKKELSSSIEKELKREISELENLIQEKERENNELKISYARNINMEKDLLSKLKQYELIDQEYQNKINRLEVRFI
jgi:hypothetical protein